MLQVNSLHHRALQRNSLTASERAALHARRFDLETLRDDQAVSSSPAAAFEGSSLFKKTLYETHACLKGRINLSPHSDFTSSHQLVFAPTPPHPRHRQVCCRPACALACGLACALVLVPSLSTKQGVQCFTDGLDFGPPGRTRRVGRQARDRTLCGGGRGVGTHSTSETPPVCRGMELLLDSFRYSCSIGWSVLFDE